jgi:hypothetical protein
LALPAENAQGAEKQQKRKDLFHIIHTDNRDSYKDCNFFDDMQGQCFEFIYIMVIFEKFKQLIKQWILTISVH